MKKSVMLIEEFGSAYEEYQRTVPMFFPKRGEWKKLMSASEFRKDEP